jgi:hypothetical protein
MELHAATSEDGFSLDELVIGLKKLMHEKGLAGILELVLNLLDEHITLQLMRCSSNFKQEPCCLDPHYEIAHRRGRTIRTSVGRIRIRWRCLRCTHCRKTIVPLREFLKLDLYQAKTHELEHTVVEIVSEQSYRRSSNHLKTVGEIPVPKSTAHRWVVQSDCDKSDTGTDTMDLLLADGTGYKRRPDHGQGLNNRGDLRIAFGVEKTGEIRPLGAWSGTDWQTIGKEIQGNRQKGQPVADILVSDGERGLITYLGKLCNSRQRCHWHVLHDLNHIMYLDLAKLTERRVAQKELAGIIGIELPAEDIEYVSEEDKQSLLVEVKEAERKVDQLKLRLQEKGYKEAASYVKRLRNQLFSYVRRWLATGLVSPRVASWIERVMREIARRLKRMAFGWSEQGAAKMARIVLKRFTNKKAWDNYWKKKLRLDGNVSWVLRDIRSDSPTNMGR